MSLLDNNEMVISLDNEKGDILSAGFTIESELMKQGKPPITTLNTNTQTGGNVSAMLKDLAVPAGLFLLQQSTNLDKSTLENETENSIKVIDETLYDKLLKPEYKAIAKKTRRTNRNKNTRRKN